MLILLSPAKTLNFTASKNTIATTLPYCLEKSEQLIQILRQKSAAEIGELMKLSTNLQQLNHQRYQQWQIKTHQQPYVMKEDAETMASKAAVLSFQGDVYSGLDFISLSTKQQQFAQQHLRILSGLYGILRPFDVIQPYRLEMGTKLANNLGNNLYDYWRESNTTHLQKYLEKNNTPYIVNLASNEYSKSVQHKQLTSNWVTPQFLDEKNGKYKIISFYAKKARGVMARWLIQNEIKKEKDILHFAENDYTYSQEHSQPNSPAFIRSAINQLT